MTSLTRWIEGELEARGWRAADLAHRAGITDATLSRILNGRRKAGPDTCLAIATALDVPPEQVFRIAGLLPALPSAIEEEKEALQLFRALDEQMRAIALGILRTLDRDGRRHEQDQEPRTFSERLAWEIARDLETMPLEDQQRVLGLMRRMREGGWDEVPGGQGEGNGTRSLRAPGAVREP